MAGKINVMIAHRVTGENFEDLSFRIKKIKSLLGDKYNCYNVFLEEYENPSKFKKFSKGDYLIYATKYIDKSDAILYYVFNDKKSEGMLMEVGYAIAKKKKRVLLIQKDVLDTYLRDVVDKVIEFDSVENLREVKI